MSTDTSQNILFTVRINTITSNKMPNKSDGGDHTHKKSTRIYSLNLLKGLEVIYSETFMITFRVMST
jgi:hypothetical protein